MNRIDNTHATFVNCLRDWNDPFLHGHGTNKNLGCNRCDSCGCQRIFRTGSSNLVARTSSPSSTLNSNRNSGHYRSSSSLCHNDIQSKLRDDSQMDKQRIIKSKLALAKPSRIITENVNQKTTTKQQNSKKTVLKNSKIWYFSKLFFL
jgi:hypothetical protein